MANGSLEELLFDDARKVKMTWPVRQNICLGVANGIHYLHSLRQPRIIHRDVKPSNIWVDQNLVPKVAGFNLAYLLPDDVINAEVDPIEGTMGYIAPEYLSKAVLSQKVDVFSFGRVLLEIMSGRGTVVLTRTLEEDVFLELWAWKLYKGEVKSSLT